MTDIKGSSRATGAKVIYAALCTLQKNGGEMSYKELVAVIRESVSFTSWELEVYETTGNIRWWAMLQFYSIDCVKAGFLTKKRRIWYLTPEGEAALHLGADELLATAQRAYRQWKQDSQDEAVAQKSGATTGIPVDTENTDLSEDSLDQEREVEMDLETVEETATRVLRGYLERKNPYEFQDIVAALLRGMGYYTPFVAPRGKDGGIDIIAYRDPLGTVPPLIKVQVKHRSASASVQEVRQLMGLMQKERDVGMFVSTGGFTPDARALARDGHQHVELVDFERFISLWQEFYSRMTDSDKSLMPLQVIYFLSPTP